MKLFDELPAEVVHQLLTQLSPAEREATALLLGYQPHTAGRIMTPEYISLPKSSTLAQAFEHIRRLATTTETIYSQNSEKSCSHSRNWPLTNDNFTLSIGASAPHAKLSL